MAQQGEGIAWIVHTHEHKDRSTDWYWTLGLVAVVGAALAMYFKNPLLAGIILIAAGSLGTLVARGPRTHWVRVTSRGVVMDGTLYPWESVHSFYIEPFNAEAGQSGRLLVTMKSYLTPQLVLNTEEPSRAAALRTFMKKYAQEEEQEPHLGEHLAEIFGL